jgi:membrane fusion protein, copper/silver efflux system
MNIVQSFKRKPKWLRLGVVMAAIAAVVAAVFVLTSDREATRPVAPPREPQSMSGMPGMDGMGATGIVTLSNAQIRQFGVTFGSVERRTLSENIRAQGIVTFDEARVSIIAPKFAGVAEKLFVNTTGAAVGRGQPVLEAYSPELMAGQEELLVAARLGASGADLLEAARARLRLLDISAGQIEQVFRNGRSQRTLTLFAATGGVVVEKNVVMGQAFEAGQTLYRIADLSTVWIEVELRESDAAKVRAGSTAAVELPAMPGRVISGRVEYVYPTLQAETRTLKARIRIGNPGLALKPGMYATARLHIPGRSALTVPLSALVRTGERNFVFVDLGGGRIMPQDVVVGRVTDEYAEVLSGAEPGQRVVTSAQFLIDSESNLGEVMRSMIGQMNAADVKGR